MQFDIVYLQRKMMRKFAPDDKYHNWDYNPYYQPENCGLELIAVLEDNSLSYEFDMIIVVKDIETEKVFMAMDSGCSCPTPFEDITGLDDMIPINSIGDFMGALGTRDKWRWTPNVIEANEVINKIQNILNSKG